MGILDQPVARVLVLGVGNVLLGDDGLGPVLVRQVQGMYRGVAEVECLDGGTQGLALLGYLAGREVLVVLDAFSAGKTPGEVSVLEGSEILACGPPRSTTAHEGNAGELLAAAQLLGELPERVFLVGVEPERLRTELGLSKSVVAALPAAFGRTCAILESLLVETGERAVM
jgi:hydrogenase maturation protease